MALRVTWSDKTSGFVMSYWKDLFQKALTISGSIGWNCPIPEIFY